MVRGLESFRKWFQDYDDQYTIIGGTACDLLMREAGIDFRATKDIDLVLIVEALDAIFAKTFWEYVVAAGYEHRNKSTGKPQFYRFKNPTSREYPAMIELFTRKPNCILLPDDAVLAPLPIDDDSSSLSAILLNDDYYDFLKQGRVKIDGITVLDAPYLIPFKAKAWLDLSTRKASGEKVDSNNIRKHKNDVFRLSELLNPSDTTTLRLPAVIADDMKEFLEKMSSEKLDLKQLKIAGKTKEDLLDELSAFYELN